MQGQGEHAFGPLGCLRIFAIRFLGLVILAQQFEPTGGPIQPRSFGAPINVHQVDQLDLVGVFGEQQQFDLQFLGAQLIGSGLAQLLKPSLGLAHFALE